MKKKKPIEEQPEKIYFPCPDCERFKMELLWLEGEKLIIRCLDCGKDSYLQGLFVFPDGLHEMGEAE